MKALLVVDVQNGLVEKELYEKDRFLGTVMNAIRKFREKNQLVIGIHHTNNQLRENSYSWEISKAIDVRSSDPIVQKTHGNAFEKTNLKKILAENEVKELLVCGLVSHGCVRATCLGGIEEGFTVNILKHGHSCWSKDALDKIRITEEELKSKGIGVIPVE